MLRSESQWIAAVALMLMLAWPAWAQQSPMLDLGDNLLANAAFEQRDNRNLPAQWTLSGAVAQAAVVRDPADRRALRLRITTRGEGTAVLEQTVEAPGPGDLLASVIVRGEGRAVLRVGKLAMSYHDQGRPQRVMGMMRQEHTGPAKLSLTLSSLDGRPAEFYIADARLHAVTGIASALPRRPGSSDTPLVEADRPAATIVIPRDDADARALADRLNTAIARRAGTALPVMTDDQATMDDTPALAAELADRHLILIGRLGTNRAIWPAYNRFLAAVDGYYPGGDGYVVRTCASVLRRGVNHLVLGGSSDAGVRRAVDRFITLLDEAAGGGGSLTVPWLLDVELGGACLEAMEARNRLWETDPTGTALPPVQSGYGTIRRWYENAMSYYWTGWDAYRRRTLAMTDDVIADDADTHHYLVEFFVNAYDMLDDSGLFSEAQRRGLDRLLLKDFLHMTTGPDVSWMTVFSPPYDAIQLTNRHAIAPWAADLRLAEHLAAALDLRGELADLVSFRTGEKRAFMRHWLNHRWAVSMPGAITTEHEEEIPAAMFRYALRHELYEFFESGRAVRALPLEKIDHLTGTCMRPGGVMDHRLILGILAHYYRDGRYRALHDLLPDPMREPFQGRYVAGIRRYTPGPELEPRSPASLAGVSEPVMDEHRRRHLRELASDRFVLPSVQPQDVLDLVTFRGGFERQDDLLMVNGLAAYELPGAILNFSGHGRRWLNGAPSDTNASAYFNNNAVHVLRTDRWLDDAPPYAAAARRDWVVQWNGGGAAALTLEPFVGMRWQRQVIRAGPGLYVVRDTLTAIEDGSYYISVNWFPAYAMAWDGRSAVSTAGGARLTMTPLGSAWTVAHETSDPAALRLMTQRTMQRGQSLTAVTVLQAGPANGEPPYVAALTGDEQALVLYDPANARKPLALLWGGRAEADVRLLRGEEQHRVSTGQAQSLPTPAGALDRLMAEVADSADRPRLADGEEQSGAGEPWPMQWTSRELQRPGRVWPQRNLPGGVADFGRSIALHEVRAYQAGGPWAPAMLPDEILVAEAEAQGGVPAADSPAWRRLDGPRRWRPGARTGNYGESAPVDQFSQVIDADGIPVRYVKANRLTGIAFYDRHTPATHRRYEIHTADFDGDGVAELLVRPEIWPKFVGRSREQIEDDVFAVFNADGSLRMRRTARTSYQTIRALDYLQRGHPQIVTASIDGRMEVLDADGQLLRDVDLFQAHVEYDRRHGRRNTRQPAGGFVMPYDVGLWYTAPGDPPGLIVSRYGWFSFIDPRGAFDGLLTAGSYVMPRLLDRPRDFTGDGALEQLCLSYGRLWRVRGPRDERIPEPGGYYYYPQVYHTRGLVEPTSISTNVDGPRPLALEPLTRGSHDRYVLVVRSNYLAIYDGRENRWTFTWTPLVDITAAAVVRCDEQSLRILAFTRDRLLWDLTWDEDLSRLSTYDARSAPDDVRAIAPAASGQAILSGSAGLYLLSHDGRLIRIAEGSFTDAVEAADGIIAVMDCATVARYRRPEDKR